VAEVNVQAWSYGHVARDAQPRGLERGGLVRGGLDCGVSLRS